MSIPASSLVASGTAGAPSAVNGCVTSDRGFAANVHAYLPYGTWNIFNVTAKLKAVAPVNASATMSILVGDADVPLAMHALRAPGGASKVAEVFKHFSLCAIRRMSALATERQTSFACDLEKETMSGQYFGFVAPGLMVCDVMVCAKQMLFTEYGVPLTKAAALMLSDEAAGFSGPADAVSPSSLAKPLIFESCAGYTSQNYRACPTGQQCTRTYKPGSGVCDCGDCSAFSNRRSCEQGDIYVGSESCCFTCPDQPICGVCQTPCNPQFQKVEVIVGTLPTTPESYTTSAYDYTSTTSAINLGTNAQTVTVTFSFQQTLTATMAYAKEFSYSEKAVAEIGIPFLNKASVEFSATQKFTTTDTKTETRTSTITYALQQQIPGLTAQTVIANASAGMIQVKVPCTIKTTYTCDKVTTEDNTMIIQTNGVLNAVDSALHITYGPQYPLSPPVVYPQANATCASNPTCASYGLKGNCCPDDKGVYNACCSFCFLKPACKEYASDNTTMCCPAQTNVRNPCCDK
ncbi:hypothetical protein OEZ85_012849 [Tetradesmus obliquus]|uniref:Uncharacterized protein n=1 Tax=Tetradesmus obliquus TaxID=3088 RepID=A0ABY8U6R9_TETOB|nr:hypothetical protein OEZ85_012849 [Tetradesmus obliquus]